jgi:hypothetical protein
VDVPVEFCVSDLRVGTKGRKRGLGPARNEQSLGAKLGQPRNDLRVERARGLRRMRISLLGVADDYARRTGRCRAGSRVERQQSTDGQA